MNKKKMTFFIFIFLFTVAVIITIFRDKLFNNRIDASVSSAEKPIVSIIGDSISTFDGTTPKGPYYPKSDIQSVNDTWWMKFINEKGFQLGYNYSWGGTTVAKLSNSADESWFFSDTRVNSLGSNGTPNYIIIFGGTNDMNANKGSGIGSFDNTTDTSTLIGAYYTLISKLKTKYPNAKLVAVLPMKIPRINETTYNNYYQAFVGIFNNNNVPWVDLSKIPELKLSDGCCENNTACINNFNNGSYDKDRCEGISNYFINHLHPNKAGANLIKNAVVGAFNKTTTVNFNRNFSSSDSENVTKTYKFGEFNQKFNNNGWTRVGYTQVGWNTNASATTSGYNTNSNVYDIWIQKNNSVILYAIWAPNTYDVRLSFDVGPITYQAKYDELFAVDNPTKTVTALFVNNVGATADTSNITKSYTFNGWDITGMDSTTHNYGSKTSTATSLSGIKETKFKNLRSTSGTVIFTPTWLPVTMTLPTVTKKGNTCKWTTENNGTKRIDSGGTWTYTSATSRTFTAECIPDTYTITYNLNGGTASNPEEYTIETATFTLNNPTKPGYTFTGWTWSGHTTPTKTVTISKGTTGNKTYTANYTINEYTVEVKVVNGTGATSKQVEYNKTTTFTVSPNSGYGNGNVSCTNGQTATLSGTTLTTGKITGNTTCTITYQKDSEPSLVIKDTTNLSLSGNNIITKLPTGTTKMTKQNFLSKITTTGEWKLYNKSNNEITSNTATITTGSSIKSGTKEYNIVILGDIDQNGEVTVADLYQSYLLFKNRAGSLTDIQKAAADYDKNNKHDLTDLFNIYKKMKNK